MPKIEHIISGIPTLGSCAGVLSEIEAVLDDPESTLADVGVVIEKDPDLTSRLLKLGNSSFFGFPSRMETVSETISLIGIQQVQDLISVSVVVEIFEGVSEELVSMNSFWKHSLACGLAARQLALARRVPKPEKFFVAGLLHGISPMVLYFRGPGFGRTGFGKYMLEAVLLRGAGTQQLWVHPGENRRAAVQSW